MSDDSAMGRARRIAVLFNFQTAPNVFFDEFDITDSAKTLRIANKITACNILVQFNTDQEQSGYS